MELSVLERNFFCSLEGLLQLKDLLLGVDGGGVDGVDGVDGLGSLEELLQLKDLLLGEDGGLQVRYGRSSQYVAQHLTHVLDYK